MGYPGEDSITFNIAGCHAHSIAAMKADVALWFDRYNDVNVEILDADEDMPKIAQFNVTGADGSTINRDDDLSGISRLGTPRYYTSSYLAFTPV